MKLDSLVIEVTRRCNMTCGHCLRGDALKRDITFAHMENMLDAVDEIGCLTFTGGEPALNLPAIRHCLDICRDRRKQVDRFYLATNGSVATSEFILLLMDWYVFCHLEEDTYFDEELASTVEISNDRYHFVDEGKARKLQCLKFVNMKWPEKYFNEHPQLFIPDSQINEGRHRENYNLGRDLYARAIEFVDGYEEDNGYIESSIYLNCNGRVINGCDWSYQSQLKPKLNICRANEFSLEAVHAYNDLWFPEGE